MTTSPKTLAERVMAVSASGLDLFHDGPFAQGIRDENWRLKPLIQALTKVACIMTFDEFDDAVVELEKVLADMESRG